MVLLLSGDIGGGCGQLRVLFAELLADQLEVLPFLLVASKFCSDILTITTASVASVLSQRCTSSAGALRREGRHAHVLRVRRRLTADFALVTSLNTVRLVNSCRNLFINLLHRKRRSWLLREIHRLVATESRIRVWEEIARLLLIFGSSLRNIFSTTHVFRLVALGSSLEARAIVMRIFVSIFF